MKERSFIDVLHGWIAVIPRPVWGVLALMAAGAILYMGTRTGSSLPRGISLIPYEDKVLHATAYALLTALTFRALYPFRVAGRPFDGKIVLVLAVPLIVGGLDEFLQGFTPGRSSDPGDLAADMAGALIVIWLGVRWRARALGQA